MMQSENRVGIQIPCLGRQFHLGMLYDRRSDQPVPDLTLLGARRLNPDPPKNFNTQWSLLVKDTLTEKAEKLDVDGHLKLSFLCGLLEVGGSGNYLSDSKKSNKHVRVALKYSMDSHYDGLHAADLSPDKVEYPNSRLCKEATHVVTGIWYGYDAILVLDMNTGSNTANSDFKGNVHAGMNQKETSQKKDDAEKLAGLAQKFVDIVSKTGSSGDANITLNFTSNEKEIYEKINITFHGDFPLDSNPQTLKEAMVIFHNLPSLIKNHPPVAKKAWLRPLHTLEGVMAQMPNQIKEIDNKFANSVERNFQQLLVADEHVNSILFDCDPLLIGFKDQMESVCGVISEFKHSYQKKLQTVLPKVREGLCQQEIIMEPIDADFTPEDIVQWMEGKQCEFNMLAKWIMHLRTELDNSEVSFVAAKQDAYRIIHNMKYSHAAALVFTVPSAFRKSDLTASKTIPQFFHEDPFITERQQMKNTIFSFITFVKSSLFNSPEKLAFVVFPVKAADEHFSARIRLFDNRSDTEIEFTPPSSPGRPVFEQFLYDHTLTSIQIKWDKPDAGYEMVSAFQISYGDNSNDDWVTYLTPDSACGAIINDVLVGGTYIFRVQCVYNLGLASFSEDSAPITIPFQYMDKQEKWVAVEHGQPLPKGAVPLLHDKHVAGKFVALRISDTDNEHCFGNVKETDGIEGLFPYYGKVYSTLGLGTFHVLTQTDDAQFCYRWVLPSEINKPHLQLVSPDGDNCPAAVVYVSIPSQRTQYPLLDGKASINLSKSWADSQSVQFEFSNHMFWKHTYVLVKHLHETALEEQKDKQYLDGFTIPRCSCCQPYIFTIVYLRCACNRDTKQLTEDTSRTL